MNTVLLILTLFFVLRLFTLFISISNESRLKKEGAIEFGKANSAILTLLHIIFYATSAYEAWLDKVQLDKIGYIWYSYVYFCLHYAFICNLSITPCMDCQVIYCEKA